MGCWGVAARVGSRVGAADSAHGHRTTRQTSTLFIVPHRGRREGAALTPAAARGAAATPATLSVVTPQQPWGGDKGGTHPAAARGGAAPPRTLRAPPVRAPQRGRPGGRSGGAGRADRPGPGPPQCTAPAAGAVAGVGHVLWVGGGSAQSPAPRVAPARCPPPPPPPPACPHTDFLHHTAIGVARAATDVAPCWHLTAMYSRVLLLCRW
jgi:hypothetical protein